MTSVHVHVQAVERPQQALGFTDINIDLLDLRFLLRRARCDAIQRTILIGNDEPPLWVGAHVDPRTLLVLGNRIQQFDFESLRDLQRFNIGRGWFFQSGCRSQRLRVHSAGPHAFAQRSDNVGRSPILVWLEPNGLPTLLRPG